MQIELIGQWQGNQLADGPLQLAATIFGMKTFFGKEFQGIFLNAQLQFAVAHAIAGFELFNFPVDNGPDQVFIQRLKSDDLINSIHQLGSEVPFNRFLVKFLGGTICAAKTWPWPRWIGSQVGGHNDDGTAKISNPPTIVG